MRTVLAVVVGVLLARWCWAAEPVCVVKLVDYAGAVTYEVKTAAELRTLQQEIRAEEPLAEKALAEAKRAWRADESHGKAPFPGSAISARQAMAMGAPFTDPQKAQDRLTDYQDKAFQKSIKAGQVNDSKAAARAQLAQEAQALFATQLAKVKKGGTTAALATPASPPAASPAIAKMRASANARSGRLYVCKFAGSAELEADLLVNNGLTIFDGDKLSSVGQTGEGVFDLQKLLPGASENAAFTLLYEGQVVGPDDQRGAVWSVSLDNQNWAVVSINEFGKEVHLEGRYLKLQMRWIGASDAGYAYLTKFQVSVGGPR